MEHPITAYIAAAGFTVVSVIIIAFLVKEAKKYMSSKED
ncbi:hypothetical protein PERMA_0225 [Persephonella marina EX-H1]|uniref:Uncharacterized protein n=1 Tax=Persephonella marina (strain DSM 14350 / EX-H1) TaxID=123214 RepID=C0QTK6_PERMH|nr:hypothetical protein PERMA_0225 [Persephonella marina EX-H1]